MTHPPFSKPKRRSWRKVRITCYLVALALLALTFYRFLFLGNSAVVEPEQVFRSAQPKQGLDMTIQDYRLASILNLRGGAPTDWWYAHEVNTAQRLGVDFYDLPLGSTRRPSRAELLALLDLFERCRYPLLIHCKSGSDRTGLAVALYRLTKLGQPPEQALGAFSLWRGHVPLAGTERLQEPIHEYSAWLVSQALNHTPERFHFWVVAEYRSDGPDVPIPPLRPGPRGEIAVEASAGSSRR
jgi:hypothetical protein